VSEIRAEQEGGKTYLQGRAASYGVMSHDLGGWREVLDEGCFDDALAAPDLDVVHTVNHDVNRVLGRSKSGTLTLSASRRGLNYRTLLPQTGYARDLTELVKRGDITSSSFAFTIADDGEDWSDVPDPEQEGKRCALRTVTRIGKLHDVSTVCSPAYPETAAGITDRSLPTSMPIELRNRILARAEDDECQCDCAECEADDCADCSNEDCADENCRCEYSMRASADGGGADSPTRTVDGEKLPQSAFLIHGDESDTSTWKLPVRFSTLAKSEKHVRLAMDLFSTLKDVSEDEKARAWKELEALAAKYGIDVDTEDDRAARVRRLELATIE
jgi:HK97 family phage prohead protease